MHLMADGIHSVFIVNSWYIDFWLTKLILYQPGFNTYPCVASSNFWFSCHFMQWKFHQDSMIMFDASGSIRMYRLGRTLGTGVWPFSWSIVPIVQISAWSLVRSWWLAKAWNDLASGFQVSVVRKRLITTSLSVMPQMDMCLWLLEFRMSRSQYFAL